MSPILYNKLLQRLNGRSAHRGFTLIELLVVVIIVSILAAVALPNLLGQIGRARETEGKNAVGAILRAEQAFHLENQAFISIGAGEMAATNELGVTLQLDFYELPAVEVSAGPPESAFLSISNSQSVVDGTRNFSGRIEFQSSSGAYSQLVCQTIAPSIVVQIPMMSSPSATCPSDHLPIIFLGNS